MLKCLIQKLNAVTSLLDKFMCFMNRWVNSAAEKISNTFKTTKVITARIQDGISKSCLPVTGSAPFITLFLSELLHSQTVNNRLIVNFCC